MRGRALALPAAAIALSLGLTACSSSNEGDDSGNDNDTSSESPSDDEGDTSDLSGTISGAGASSQQAAQTAWQAGFLGKYPEITVNYDAIGSGGGREQFIAGATDFGGTDAYFYDDDEEPELTDATARCAKDGGELLEIPTYVSPIAVVFNLEGVDSLNLKPEVIAGIFNQEITQWDDEAIAADNPDADLPDTAITPVNRSDESGTTENFVEYLAAVVPDAWPHDVSGDWPVSGGEAGDGTSGVIASVNGGNGTIGYADASQAGGLGTVNVGVGDEFVPYSPEAAAKIVEVSERAADRGEYDFAIDLARDTTESGTYPIVLISYTMACTSYADQNKADMVKAYLSYMISAEGQQASADQAGSAPISDTLRAELQAAIDTISAAS
jgi:phosphate transport system substrate-binding protein